MSEVLYYGTTSQTIDVFLQDSSSTTGQGLAGLVYNTSGLKAYYRKGATGTVTAITLATQTVAGTWSSGGFVEVDATNAKGQYRFDIPNVVIDTEGFTTLFFYGATNLLPTALRIDCRPFPVDVKRLLGTASAGAAGYMAIDTAQAVPSNPAANTYGEVLLIIDNLVGRMGTAQAGASTTITLDSSASSTDGRYVGYMVYLYGGTGGGARGVGQERTITAYVGSTKIATLAQAWSTTPDATTKFMLYPQPFANVGIWNGTVIAASATAGIPDVNAKQINAVSTSAVTTVKAVQGLAVDGVITTVTNQLTAVAIATGVWQDATSGDFTVSGSIGKSLFTTGAVPGASGGISIVGSAMTLAASQHVIVDSGTVTTVTNQLTAAAIATGVWQDTTAGDFTVSGSIGKSLFTSGNAPGAASGIALVGSNMGTITGGTITTYTGNTPQTGDSFARIGLTGSGLTSLMAAYTQPSGFLAATFPTTVASTTNITAGTMTTVTNLTNAATAGDLTAAMKASVTAAVPTASQNAIAVEAAILNEGDATALLAAIAAKVETFLINDGDATATLAAIAAACNTAVVAGTLGTNVTAIKAKTDLIPASPASTTNITAGTITTVTNLTNAATSGGLTATMKTDVTTAATAATPIAASVASYGTLIADIWAYATRTITGFTLAGLAKFFNTDSGTTYASAVPGSVVKEIADNAGGGSGGTVGSGSIEKQITITSGGQPVDGAAVWITTDEGGTNVVAGTLYTDEFGNVTFMLDETGVGEFYYCWKQRAGVNFTNPESFTVA